MKKITSTLLRLFASYSKLLIMIFILSVSGTSLKADDGYTYLKCGKKYIKFDGYNLKTNYNNDTKKALTFNRNLLMENFIIPHGLKFPLFRNILENYFL